MYKTLGCAVCQQNNVEETWDHFLSCPELATQRADLHTLIKRDSEIFLIKKMKKLLPDASTSKIWQQIQDVILSLLGRNDASVDFKIFYKWAVEVKLKEQDIMTGRTFFNSLINKILFFTAFVSRILANKYLEYEHIVFTHI